MSVEGSVLSVRDLEVVLRVDGNLIKPVAGLTFDVKKGETLAIVGESGSGKSITAASIMSLLPVGGAIEAGEILLNGTDLRKLSEAGMQQIRGQGVALMPQNPMTSLNPSLTVGFQVAEPIIVHQRLSKREAKDRVIDILGRTGIADSASILDAYPHQLSGGMRQRVVLSMALVARPMLLIADEPTTALDVTTQEQIVDLLQDIQQESGLSLIIITHDLGVVARIARRVLVMYAGRQLEYGTADEVFFSPGHPYTRGLLDSVDFGRYAPGDRLRSIGGAPPQFDALPTGCVFRPRCVYAQEVCTALRPRLLVSANSGHPVACHPLHTGELPLWSRHES